MTDQQMPPGLPDNPEEKPIWSRWWMIVVYTVLGLGVLGSLVGDDTGTDTSASETSTSADVVATSTTSSDETTTTVGETTTSTTTTTQPTTTTTEAQTAQPDPVVFSGSGDEVIEFGPDLAWLNETFGIFSYVVGGAGNNAVWALDADFEPMELLVNTIGSDTGTRLISFTDDAAGLEVGVSGDWGFTILPPTNLFPPKIAADFNVSIIDTTGTYEGAETEAVSWTGPNVIALKTDERVAEITANGDGNIAIWAYSTKGAIELLVNEIDTFEGSVLLPDCAEGCWLDIAGEMTYSLSIRP